MKYRYLILLLFLILLVVPASADWLSGYDYRKSHVITGNSTWGTAQTNYQMKYLIYRSSGTDSGNSIYVGTSCQDDYDDIRFTTSDGTTLCDYWIESYTSALATVWVEVPSIATTTTTVYMYYGNSSATSVSNGLNTFVLFDTFDEASLNTTKWTSSGSITKLSGGVILDGGSLTSTSIFNLNSSLYVHATTSTWTTNQRFGFSIGSYPSYAYQNSLLLIYNGSQYASYYVTNSSGSYSENFVVSHSKYFVIKQNTNSSSTYTKYYTGTFTLFDSELTSLNSSHYVYLLSPGAGNYLSVHEVFLCKELYNPPIISSWVEETANITANFSVPLTGIPINTVVYFTDLSSGYITNWSWDVDGDGSFDNTTEQNPAYKYTVAGIYNVSLKINNSYKFDWENKTSYIYVAQPPNASFYGSPENGSAPLTVSFYDTTYGGTPSAWNWSFGDGEYSDLQNPSHTYNLNGNYTVILNSSNTVGFNFSTRTDYIVVASNDTDAAYGSQYPPHTVRFVVQDYYGNPISNLNVVATSTQTTMQWGWLKSLFGINDAVNLRYTSMSGTTGSDGSISFIMLETIGYSIRFYNTTQGIDHTELLFPQEQEYLIHIHTQNEMNFTPSTDYIWYDLNVTTESNESMTFYGYTNISAGYVDSIRFYVEWSNGTILHEETKILPVIETFVYNVPLSEGDSVYYGFNITSTSFGNKNPVKAATFPDDIDWNIPSEYLGWAGAGLILLFAAIFTRGTIEIGLIVLPIVALLLTMMDMLPVTIGAPATILLFLGVLIYIRSRYSG